MKSYKISKMDVQRYNSGQTLGHISNYPELNPFLRGGDGLRRQALKCPVVYLRDWRKGPKVIRFCNFVRKLLNDYLIRTNYGFGKLASDCAAVMENQLFMEATSEEEYVNVETLSLRLQRLLNLYDPNSSQPAGSAETPSNCLGGAIRSDSICNNAFVANNADDVNLTKGLPFNGDKQGDTKRFTTSDELDMPCSLGLWQASSDTVLPLEDTSTSFAAYSNANQENRNYISDISSDCQVQQQHLGHGRLGSNQNAQSLVCPSTEGNFSVFSSSNLLIPQHFPMDVPEVSNILPGTICSQEIATLEDIVQSCSQMIKSQHNRKQSLNPLMRSQVPPVQSLGAQHYASDDPSAGNIEGMPHLSKRLKMGNINGNNHLLVPSIVQHCVPGGLSYQQQQSESPTSLNFEDIVQSCSQMINCQNNKKRCPHPLKQPQYASDGPSSGNIKDIPPSVVQNCVPEGLSYLQQQPKSPAFISSEDIVQSCSQMIKSKHNRKWPVHPYLQPQFPPEQSHDIPPSSKKLKMENKNENYHLLAPSVVQPCAPEGLSYLQQQSESPVSINSEVTHVEMEPANNSIQDSMRINDVTKCDSDIILKLNSESVLIPSGEIFSCHHMEQIDLTSSSEIIDNVKEVSERMGSKSSHFFSEGLTEKTVRTDFTQTDPKPDSDLKEVIKPQNQETNSVLLTELLKEEPIKEHLSSLGQSIDQSILMEERENSEKVCQLCASGKFFFAPAPVFCSCCNARLKRGVNHYCMLDERSTRYCFCNSCYKGLFMCLQWVQCDKCKGWQHQICAVLNDNSALEGKVENTCLKCLLKETECGELMNLPKSYIFSAKDLPTTMLSDHIEQRLFRRLMQEREERAKVHEKEFSEAPGAEDLVVRAVLSVKKTLKVKQKFLDLFHDENYPAEFPYKSKVILLFQKIEGVDVCLFGMYVQEFGSACSHPNKRCVYISYLDSIKYFRPETKTVTGEALRTFVYHEILVVTSFPYHYLGPCFVTSYIWACAPLNGEDYILYCHPELQKMPKPEKLLQWYHSLIKKAADEKIVVSHTNLYDRFFIPSGECNSKVTAARLRYFDGDYWSGATEEAIRKIEQERMADTQKKSKITITKTTLKAMGHTDPSDGSTKDILLMQRMGQSILQTKEDFMIVDMQYVCTHCHERKNCGQDIHISANMERHVLSQVVVEDVLSDTKDDDVISDNNLLENRHTFLSFCEKKHYQFGTLRRAKYSSKMILHHLHNATVLTGGNTCVICHKDAVVDQGWVCEICPEFDVCATCYREKGSACHIHKLTQSSPSANRGTENRNVPKKGFLTRELLDVLQHATTCKPTKIQPCFYPNCLQMKKLLYHADKCTVRATGGCLKAWSELILHSINCRKLNCTTPRCM
ncbi:histone acetyltransferase HAC12-like [Pyrus ussuriensis x Pyrus communis]|uniref:histone acetyltransferase n=1 Tax=Pyrus ussuriensis x Pyrus communis TaxID=2448454 RepID=A0A5N5GE19_9ROSA|nr:histone acetyltransferase HAC12-like [Pyrus ussuriensis x Pyrus communis]